MPLTLLEVNEEPLLAMHPLAIDRSIHYNWNLTSLVLNIYMEKGGGRQWRNSNINEEKKEKAFLNQLK